jgi:hypothetical protein
MRNAPNTYTPTTLTRVYNTGDLGSLACGWRSLIALAPGRKWITVVDWTTLESARVSLTLRNRIPKIPTTDFSKRRVCAYMLARCQYTPATAVIKQAIGLMGRSKR